MKSNIVLGNREYKYKHSEKAKRYWKIYYSIHTYLERNVDSRKSNKTCIIDLKHVDIFYDFESTD